MRDFDEQLKAYGDEMRNIRCPYSEAELDREIRSVIWRSESRKQEDETPTPGKKFQFSISNFPFKWPAVAAAACLLTLLIPLGLRTKATAQIAQVDVDGEQIYFACNNGCSADATIETFKTLLR